MKDKVMNGLMRFAMFLQEQRHFAAIKNAFSSLLPIIIVGLILYPDLQCNLQHESGLPEPCERAGDGLAGEFQYHVHSGQLRHHELCGHRPGDSSGHGTG